MSTLYENFASIGDLEKSWKTIADQSDKAKACALLCDASTMLRQIAKNNGVDIDERIWDDEDGVYGQTVKLVVVNVVRRTMTTPTDAPPADAWTMQATPYSQTMRLTNPDSRLYFKRDELDLLGLGSVSGRSKIGVLRGVR